MTRRIFPCPTALLSVAFVAAAFAVHAQERVAPDAVVPVARAGTVQILPLAPVADVRVFEPGAALPAPVVARGGADLPRPSILLGAQARERVFDAAFTTGDPDAEEIAWDNLAARTAMRAEDPALYARLVARGAFDPPDSAMARALQAELARMNCYTAGIDGDWGRGSVASVARYVEAGGEAAPTTAATSDLWRHIIAAPDVACPQVAAPVAVRATTPARTTRAQPARSAPVRSAPAARAAPAPTPAAPAPTRGFGRLGGGIIR